MSVKYFSLLLLLTGTLYSCKTAYKKVAAPKDEHEVYQKQYYQELGNNMSRLLAIRSGLFVQYRLDAKSEISPWKRGDDSLFLYIRPVGIPNRDGHWLLSQQFLSGLPAEPLATWLEYIKRINRDSFESYSRGWTTTEEQPTFLEVSAEGFDVTEYGISLSPPDEEEEPKRFFKRKEVNHFFEETVLKRPLNQERREKYAFRKTTNDYRPRWVTVQALYFDSDTTLLTVKTNKKLRLPKDAASKLRQAYLAPEEQKE